jgi:prephenate dehydrogenase
MVGHSRYGSGRIVSTTQTSLCCFGVSWCIYHFIGSIFPLEVQQARAKISYTVTMKTIGVIGYGSFGEFMVHKLDDTFVIKVHDPHANVPDIYSSMLQEVAQADYIVLAIPIVAYRTVLTDIKPLLKPTSVIVDISSVKTTPVTIIEEILPSQKRVIMHPLFGPQSADKSFWGHVVVMCPNVSDPAAYEDIKKFIVGLGLAIVEKSPEEHDREMAYAQGLTFFMARVLLTMNIHDVSLITPSFKKLLDLAELESHHSEELFRTIQTANPYLDDIRSQFISIAETLNTSLAE